MYKKNTKYIYIAYIHFCDCLPNLELEFILKKTKETYGDCFIYVSMF